MKTSRRLALGLIVLPGLAWAGTPSPPSGFAFGPAVAAVSSGPAGPSSGAYNSAGSSPGDYNLGINFPGLSYYNNAPVYADVANQMSGNSGRWDANSGGAAPLDATGAPTVAAWAGFTADYLSGQYTLSWDGAGSVRVDATATGPATVTQNDGVTHNVVTVTLTANPSSTGTNWTRVTATPPVTNIHLMAPASDQAPGGLFTKSFLTKIAPFSNVRFMDALNTNGNTIENWSQRTWPAAGSRGGTPQGIAYEDIIALANLTGKNVYINVPVRATDDYVCRLARLFRYGEPGDTSDSACSPAAPSSAPAGATALNAKSKVYVEFSNEIWNWGFEQVEDVYCMTWGAPAPGHPACPITAPTSLIGQAALADASLPWNNGNTWAKGGEFAMVLTKRDNDIFKAVFGTRAAQVVTVMNVQSAYAAEADDGFTFMKKGYGPVGGYMDAMAVAPYFGISNDTYAYTLDGLFDHLSGVLLPTNPDGSGNSIYQWIAGDLAEANKFGLPLIAYEGGEGLSGSSNAAAQANEIAAQSDPRMSALTRQYFAVWDSLVGRSHLFNYYTLAGGDGPFGMWGALVNSTDPGSQKFDALLGLVLIPGDANMDGAADQSDCAIVQANYGKTGMWWTQGDFNHDGAVDAADLAILNARIAGAPCAAP